jgi:ABC-type uncharacterized transport system ATPase subunit
MLTSIAAADRWTPMAPFLEMRNITKRFPGVLANDHINLTVEAGQIHALLGENGAGKSTLMQILYGLYQRDEGDIVVAGRNADIRSPEDAIALGIGMIHQDFMLIRPFTVVENIVLGLNENRGSPLLDLTTASRTLAELSQAYGLAVDPGARVEHLPVGVQQRVEILKLLYRSAKLLILDEPTGVLTPQEVEGLFGVLRRLANQGHAVIFITHKLHEVMAIADTVTVLRDGHAIATLDPKASSAPELARLMVGRDVVFHIDKKPPHRGAVALEARDLRATDDAGHERLRGLTVDVCAGEIVGLAGVDGNGQSELAEALMNLRPIRQGRVLVLGTDVTRKSPAAHRRAGMAYIPADRRQVGSVGDLSIVYNAILGYHNEFTMAGGLFFDERRMNAHARSLVEHYDVRTPGVSFIARKLSGGNLQKVVLGRELTRQPKVLVVEQPTRGLDVGATEYVRRQLLHERDRGAAILLISADLEEIQALSDRIAVIYKGEIMGTVRAEGADIQSLGLMMAGTRTEGLPGGAL